MIGAALSSTSKSYYVAYNSFPTPNAVGALSLTGAATSNMVIANVVGGVGGYEYLWSRVSGDALTINAPTLDRTTFTSSGSKGQSKESVIECVITDLGNGSATTSFQISVSFDFESND